MKLKKLLNRLSALTDAKQHEQLEQCQTLKKTLKQLKQKNRDLKKRLAIEKDSDKRHEIEDKIKIIKAQRRKGLALLKEIRTLPGSDSC